MVINVVGNVADGKGLAADARLIRSLLPNHTVRDVMWNAHEARRADVNIFLEVDHAALRRIAPVNILIPNVELFDLRLHGAAPYTAIWAKTRHAYERLRSLDIASPVEYLGFTCEDRYLPDVRRERVALHVAGGSRFRNTEAVVRAWAQYWRPGDPELIVVARPIALSVIERLPKCPQIEYFVDPIPDDEYRVLQNRCAIHVLPSQYEGFGLALWEARSVGAVLVTTDAAPMNEASASAFVPGREQQIRRNCIVEGTVVAPADVWSAVTSVWDRPPSKDTRLDFLRQRVDFLSRFTVGMKRYIR